jgi:hypothetical protein
VNPTDTVSAAWGLVDDWQLIMWLLAVPAFFYQLLIAIDGASPVEHAKYRGLTEGMDLHVDFGKQLLALTRVPPAVRKEALDRIEVTLLSIAQAVKATAQ